uniref:class I adenylate-forming enzyme family protein n=1 Tax=uncultured Allobacillus sp. TaxID=1638025 RepID=UPI002598C461|nr:AMP-binding protein [uncultured Allobacillus sp.]
MKRGSVGQEMIFNNVQVVDDRGNEVEQGEVGELWLHGNHLFEFYWNNDEETSRSLEDGWLKTGDLARIDEDGFVYIIGRKKEMIISGGENIFPLEIEHWLQSNEAVNEVAVLGIPDEKWGEKVVAYVSVKDDQITEVDLEMYCAEKLSRYKKPKSFHIIDELPKPHVEKTDKNALMTTPN